MGKIMKLRGRINDFFGRVIGSLRRSAEYLCSLPKFSKITLIMGAASIAVAIFSLIFGLLLTVLLSEDTNELVVSEADTSRREIVSAIETSSAVVKETIETSNESLGTKIVSELGEKIESSNESLGTKIEASNSELKNSIESSGNQIVSAIMSLGNNPGQESDSSNFPTEEVHESVEDDLEKENNAVNNRADEEDITKDGRHEEVNKTFNEEEVYDYFVRLLEKSDSIQFSVDGKPALNISIDSE